MYDVRRIELLIMDNRPITEYEKFKQKTNFYFYISKIFCTFARKFD